MTVKQYKFPAKRDLGQALPNCEHAVSVALPKWQDVIDYEENNPRVIDALQAGYPRFTYHPITKRLFAQALEKFAKNNEDCIILPSYNSAIACQKYIAEKSKQTATIHQYPDSELYALIFPEETANIAKDFWQHTGLIISSRQAEDILAGKQAGNADSEKLALKQRLSTLSQQPIDNILLYATGMTAIYDIHKAITKHTPNAKTIQLGFAYVDTLKIQQKFGADSHLITYNDDTYLAQVEKLINSEKISAIFCEIPSNPELKTIDIAKLSQLLSTHNIPLIIDDTIAAWQVDIADYADIFITSLTKYFSGASDVLGGSLIFNQKSAIAQKLQIIVANEYEDLLYPTDIITLNNNSQDFTQRIKKINQSTEIIVNFLSKYDLIARIYYPKITTTDNYLSIKKDGGGYGGLFSILFKKPEHAKQFYDALTLCKGPSLGTNFTLLCPYVLLAHYHELPEIEAYGIDCHLIRISIGLENPKQIIQDFETALASI